MNYKIKFIFIFFIAPYGILAQYLGTGSVTKGKAKTVLTNLYSCAGGRISGIGEITSSDSLKWVVPAEVNFNNSSFPFSSDLNNSCNGSNYTTTQTALSKLNGSDIVLIDSFGEVFTAFIFADNYFEMYVNGVPVGKDKVPFTQFNSSIVRFKVKKPFTIAMMLVDWEENLGLGSELNGGFAYHPGDGGVVATIIDNQNKIVATTNADWRVQTYYTAPIKDLTCLSEVGKYRYSSNCNHSDVNDGSQFFGIHWKLPNNWYQKDFIDTFWPFATTYLNSEIGVDNKPAYTNFKDIFDQTGFDAQFIWTSNVILDNLILARYKVGESNQSSVISNEKTNWNIPNPVADLIQLPFELKKTGQIYLMNTTGKMVILHSNNQGIIDVSNLSDGVYFMNFIINDRLHSQKLVIQK